MGVGNLFCTIHIFVVVHFWAIFYINVFVYIIYTIFGYIFGISLNPELYSKLWKNEQIYQDVCQNFSMEILHTEHAYGSDTSD